MENSMINTLIDNYNILAALLSLVTIAVISRAGKWLVFKSKALQSMLQWHCEFQQTDRLASDSRCPDFVVA